MGVAAKPLLQVLSQFLGKFLAALQEDGVSPCIGVGFWHDHRKSHLKTVFGERRTHRIRHESFIELFAKEVHDAVFSADEFQ